MDWRFTLKHKLTVDKLQFTNNEFETSIDGWDQINTGSDIAFTWNNPSSARASGSAANTTGIGMTRPDNGGRWKPGTYKVMLDVSNQSTGGSEPLSSFLTVYGSITGSSLDDDITYSGDSGIWAVSTSDEREIEFTLTKEYEKLFFKWDKSGSDSGYNVDIIIHSIKLVSIEDVFDEHEITEPDGWKETRIVLERHPEFFSLIETLTANYVFYGTDDRGVDGGYHFIKRVEENYGIDEQLSIRIEFDPDDTGDYETVFEGLLDIAGSTTLPDNKIQVPLVRDDFWTRFINRFETPVDLTKNEDIDGNEVTPMSPVTLQLKPQPIRKRYRGTIKETPAIAIVSIPNGEYFQLDFDNEEISEIAEKHLLPRVVTSELPTGMFTIGEPGDYEIDLEICAGEFVVAGYIASNTRYKIYIQFNNDSGIELTETNIEFGDNDEFTKYTYSDTVKLVPGDIIRIYVQRVDISGGNFCLFGTDPSSYVPSGFDEPSTIDPDFYSLINPHLSIIGNTTYPETTTEGYFLHDLFYGVLDRIGLHNAFYSEILGSPITKTRQYEEHGCYSNFFVTKGMFLRGYTPTDNPDDPTLRYTLQEKGFQISFKDLWELANPIFNLGLGYEDADDSPASLQLIRIEEKGHFVDTTKSINVSNIRDISYAYDGDFIFKTINVGYKEWESESASGIDDPQTKRTYATRLRYPGEELTLESSGIAASLAIETTRRKRVEISSDYKFDNKNFIIAINADDVSPDTYIPELDENFDSVTNLLNSDSRYNLILTPMRNLLRWAKYIGGCLQSYATSAYKFVSGEGNYDMISKHSGGDKACQAVLLDELGESQDISLQDYNDDLGYYFLPLLYDITFPITWDDVNRIRNNRKKAIGISQTEANHKAFIIKKLEYSILTGKVESLNAWPVEYMPIQVIDQDFNRDPEDLPDENSCEAEHIFEFIGDLNGWESEPTGALLEELSGFDNGGAGGQQWTLGAKPTVELDADVATDYLRGEINTNENEEYTFFYDISLQSHAPINPDIRFFLLDGSNNILARTSHDFKGASTITSGSITGAIKLTPIGDDGVYLAIRLINHDGAVVHNYTVNSIKLAIPWVWSNAYGGSVTAQTIFDDIGVDDFVIDGITLPQENHKIKVTYAVPVNNSDVTLTLVFKDAGGNQIGSEEIASSIPDTFVHTSEITILDSDIWEQTKKLEIHVSSNDFEVGDEIYITRVEITSCEDETADIEFDADYQAILDYATGEGYTLPSFAQQVKQNAFVVALKAAGIWTQLDLLYVFATDGDRDFAKINWVDPGNFTATEVNAPTFTENEGFTGNGSNAYLDTGWDSMNNGDNFQEEEGSWFFYCNNNISNNTQVPFGLHEDTTAGANLIFFNLGGANINVSQINSAGFQTSFDGTNGFFHCRRVSDNDVRLFKNGTQAGFSNAIATTGLSTLDWYILARNSASGVANASLLQVSFFGIGASLSGSESDLYDAWNDYFTNL